MNKIFLTLFVFIISCSTNDGEPQYPYGIIRPSENAESFGCGNVFVYQFIDSKMAITLRIKSSLVNLSQENQTLTLNDDSDKFVVTIEEAGNSPDSIYFNYCNDVRFHNQGVLKRYNASRGTITFFCIRKQSNQRSYLGNKLQYIH